MIRNMDLIRLLILKLEAYPMRAGSIVAIMIDDPDLAIEGFDADQIYYHLCLIREAGLIDSGGVNPMLGIGFRSVTWSGHDFIDSVRDPKIWDATKKGAAAAGGFTVDLLKDLAKGLIRKQVEKYTGVEL